MSAAVHTAKTPGSARAAAVSIADDAAMGMGGAHHAHVKLMREIDVAGKRAAPGDQRRIFQPLDRLADPFFPPPRSGGGDVSARRFRFGFHVLRSTSTVMPGAGGASE